MNEPNHIITIDELFRQLTTEGSVTPAPGSGWPAMEVLLDRYLPLPEQLLPEQDEVDLMNKLIHEAGANDPMFYFICRL